MVLNFAGEVEKRHLVVALANGVGIFAVLIYTSGLGSGLARWHDASYVEVFLKFQVRRECGGQWTHIEILS